MCEYELPAPEDSVPPPPTENSKAIDDTSAWLFAIPRERLQLTPFESELTGFYQSFVSKFFVPVANHQQLLSHWAQLLLVMTDRLILVRRSLVAYLALLIHKFAPHRQFCLLDQFTLLYTQMLANFHQAITTLKQVMAAALLLEGTIEKVLVHPDTVFAILILGIFVVLFLSRHPHKLMPLLAFEEDGPLLHFMAIARGVRETIILWAPSLYLSQYQTIYAELLGTTAPLLAGDHNADNIIPMLAPMFADLDDAYIPPAIKPTLQQSMQVLNAQLHDLAQVRLNLELTKFLLRVPSEFFDLVFQKNFFALRIMFVFLCLLLLLEFWVLEQLNMWVDYLEWFRQYNFTVCDQWMYPHDRTLYDIAFTYRLHFPLGHYHHLELMDLNQLLQLAMGSTPATSVAVVDPGSDIASEATVEPAASFAG